jgi:hypothetical protein
MRLVLAIVLFFLSGSIFARGYRSGRSNVVPNAHKKIQSTKHISSVHPARTHHNKGMSRHAYKQLRSRIAYLKTLQASKESFIDPRTGDRVYNYPEAIISFPGKQVTEAKFKRSAFFQKYKMGSSSSDLALLEKNVTLPEQGSEVTATIDNSCEKAIETRKIVERKKDRKSEALYQKYKRMCEEK